MTGHLIRRITKGDDGHDRFGPYKPCPTCGGPAGIDGLLGDYYEALVELDELRAEIGDEVAA